jgi:hypothetical protein
VALILPGLTECVVCNEVLNEGDDIVGLPPFATGPADPHWRFTDSGLHRGCWDDLPEREAVQERLIRLDARFANDASTWLSPGTERGAIEQVRDAVRRYYSAHAQDQYVESDLLAVLHDDLLQRILVDELGGDTLEQAFYEGNLFHPPERLSDAAAFAQAEYEIRIEDSTAEARVEEALLELRRTDGVWKIAAFR